MEPESIVQPGAPLLQLGPMPPPLNWRITLPPRAWGGGRYSDVYRVSYNMDGRNELLCVKVLRTTADDPVNGLTSQERLQRRIRRETITWSKAQGLYIYPYYGYMVVEDTTWLISPWAELGDLNKYLYDNPSLTYKDKLKLAQDVARGLAHLHNLEPPISHGDLSPQNVLINKIDGIATGTLSDFGLARIMAEPGIHTGLTTSGNTLGTLPYSAKELHTNSPAFATPMTDVYSLGGIILFAMSGKGPFHTLRRAYAALSAIIQDQQPNPVDHPELPADDPLWPILRRCWDPRPQNRPSAEDVVESLESLLSPSESV